MAEAGRRLMLARFTMDRTVADIDSLYREVVATTRLAGLAAPVSNGVS